MFDMEGNVIFNATVSMTGCFILLVHIANVALKRKRRQDENRLLLFLVFTAIHFATYAIFTLLRHYFPSDALIMGFYTGFYIANNLEVFLLFLYMLSYVRPPSKMEKRLLILNHSLFAVFFILDIANLFGHFFFYSVGGVYQRGPALIASQIYQFVMFATVFLVVILNKGLKRREKVAFSVYCFLPLVAIVVQDAVKGYAIAYLSMIVAIEVLFFFLSAEKNLELVTEERKAKEAQVRVMLSQIQPHFIYNTLSSISTLIAVDPAKAQSGLDDFTEYLRANLSSLTEDHLIPFEDELRHIETYVSLEKMRFGSRLNVVYDIQVKDFSLPPLTVQPMVENAIKHGALAKLEGGTVTLRTYERDGAYVVEVEDDGVGFDPEKVHDDGRTHFGLTSARDRLRFLCDGDIRVESHIGAGTRITITFNKEKRA